jgi:hypothetical protein
MFTSQLGEIVTSAPNRTLRIRVEKAASRVWHFLRNLVWLFLRDRGSHFLP